MIDSITIYTILLAIMLFVAIARKNNLVLIVILSYYTAVGIMGIVGVRIADLDEFQAQTTVFPYLFLIICYAIHFSPLMRNNNGFDSQKVNAIDLSQYKLLIYAFIFAGAVSIILYIRPVLSLISSEAWKSNRILLLDDEIVYPYSNRIEYLMLNFSNYFALPLLIISTIIISKGGNKILGWTTLIISIAYRVLACLYTSSRGGIFNLAIMTIVIFSFFLKDMKKTSKTFSIFLGITAVIVLFPVMASITADRFGDDFASTSVWRYFGQPAIMFSYSVVPIKRLALGRYAFSHIFDTGYSSFDYGGKWEIGGNWGSVFFTFVGYEYIDWGPIGCLLIGGIIAWIMNKIITKETYRPSDLYLIFSYIQFLVNGCLVIGRNYTLQIILSLVVYGIMRFLFESNKSPRTDKENIADINMTSTIEPLSCDEGQNNA